MKKDFQLPARLEVKFVGDSGVFEGYASVFNVTDSANDRVLRGAFDASLKKWRQEGVYPPLLWQHDVKQPIGAWRDISEDAHGLFVRGELFTADIARAREAQKLMREGVVTGLSIGYQVRQSRQDPDTGERLLTELDLMEISMVTFPANQHARIHRVKSMLSSGVAPAPRELELYLRHNGFSRRQAKALIAGGYRSMHFSPRDAARPREAVHTGGCDEGHDLRALAALIRSLI